MQGIKTLNIESSNAEEIRIASANTEKPDNFSHYQFSTIVACEPEKIIEILQRASNDYQCGFDFFRYQKGGFVTGIKTKKNPEEGTTRILSEFKTSGSGHYQSPKNTANFKDAVIATNNLFSMPTDYYNNHPSLKNFGIPENQCFLLRFEEQYQSFNQGSVDVHFQGLKTGEVYYTKTNKYYGNLLEPQAQGVLSKISDGIHDALSTTVGILKNPLKVTALIILGGLITTYFCWDCVDIGANNNVKENNLGENGEGSSEIDGTSHHAGDGFLLPIEL
jgi:hypothetical protein